MTRPERAGAATVITAAVGAAGSVAFMLHAGRRQSSPLLLLLFTVWVVSPFVAFVWEYQVSKRWRVFSSTTLNGLVLALTLGSLTAYGVATFGPPLAKPAAVFLMVPLASWLVLAVIAWTSRRSRTPL